jgi:predicted aconitase with swiveling domain
MSDAAPRTIVLHGRRVVGGRAEGEALVTRQTISGWGGINERDGTIIERRHELRGQVLGRVRCSPARKDRRAGPPISTWRGSTVWPRPR